jgi:hypothetical protein
MFKIQRPSLTFRPRNDAAVCDENTEMNRLCALAEAEDILSDSSTEFNDSLHSDISELISGAPVRSADQAPAGMHVSDPSQVLITAIDSLGIADHAAGARLHARGRRGCDAPLPRDGRISG